MLRISKLADYGTVLMRAIAEAPTSTHTAKALAEQAAIPLPTVSKLLKLFASTQLLQSQRGAQGGYQLAQAPADISLAQIVAAIDGEIALTECSHSEGNCERAADCVVSDHWQVVSRSLQQQLQAISLAELVKGSA